MSVYAPAERRIISFLNALYGSVGTWGSPWASVLAALSKVSQPRASSTGHCPLCPPLSAPHRTVPLCPQAPPTLGCRAARGLWAARAVRPPSSGGWPGGQRTRLGWRVVWGPRDNAERKPRKGMCPPGLSYRGPAVPMLTADRTSMAAEMTCWVLYELLLFSDRLEVRVSVRPVPSSCLTAVTWGCMSSLCSEL